MTLQPTGTTHLSMVPNRKWTTRWRWSTNRAATSPIDNANRPLSVVVVTDGRHLGTAGRPSDDRVNGGGPFDTNQLLIQSAVKSHLV